MSRYREENRNIIATAIYKDFLLITAQSNNIIKVWNIKNGKYTYVSKEQHRS